jgi:hypothetical protein
VLPDVYVHVDIELTHLVMCRAAALTMPPGAALGGASAALLHGADVLGREDLVEVTVPHHARMRSRRGLRIRSAYLEVDDVVLQGGIAVTSAVRTAFDVARWRQPQREAVVAVDAMLTTCHLTIEAIRDYAIARQTWWKARRAQRVLHFAAHGAESPGETRLRLVLLGGKLPLPALQHDVIDCAGRHIARLDLAYPEHRLGIEYDGGYHWEPKAIKKDLLRQNALRANGWGLLRFTSDDVLRHPARLLGQVRASAPGLDDHSHQVAGAAEALEGVRRG